MKLYDELFNKAADRENATAIRQGGSFTGGIYYNGSEQTYVRSALIVGDGEQPTGTGGMWGAQADMPWIYPAHISMGRWRSGSGVGDDFVSGIWLDPAIPEEYSTDPLEVGVWAGEDVLLSGDYVNVIQRGRHWEVVTSAGSSAKLCKTTGAPTAGQYPVEFYNNGKNQPSTGTGTVEVVQLTIGEDLPAYTWLIAHSFEVVSTVST